MLGISKPVAGNADGDAPPAIWKPSVFIMYSTDKREFGCEKQGVAFEEEKRALESERRRLEEGTDPNECFDHLEIESEKT